MEKCRVFLEKQTSVTESSDFPEHDKFLFPMVNFKFPHETAECLDGCPKLFND